MLQQMIQNAALLRPAPSPTGNGPPPSETGQRMTYMDDPAKRILEQMAPYATDFFGAQAQGMDPDDFWRVKWYEIRAADVFPSASISDNSRHNDWKIIVFRRRDIDYIPAGAKIWFWKNCWLAYNPENMGGAYATAVVHRCNQVWKRYDYYGNILEEPFVVERAATRANANEYNIYEALPDHYNNCYIIVHLLHYVKHHKPLRRNTFAQSPSISVYIFVLYFTPTKDKQRTKTLSDKRDFWLHYRNFRRTKCAQRQ